MNSVSIIAALDEASAIIDRTEENISKLDVEITRWLKSEKIAAVPAQFNLEGGQSIIKVVVPAKEVPVEFQQCVRVIAVNLWLALETVGNASFNRSIDPTSGRDSVFEPSAGGRIVDKFPEPLRPLVAELEPKRGGSGEPLWLLYRILRRQENQIVALAPIPHVDQIDAAFRWDGKVRRASDKSFILQARRPVENIKYDIKIPIGIVFERGDILRPVSISDTLFQANTLIVELCDLVRDNIEMIGDCQIHLTKSEPP